jgi:hypothetical protein
LQRCQIYKHAGRVNFYPGTFFESYLEIKEIIISRVPIFGRIGVGLWTKDKNPTGQSYPATSKSLEIMGLKYLEEPISPRINFFVMNTKTLTACGLEEFSLLS